MLVNSKKWLSLAMTTVFTGVGLLATARPNQNFNGQRMTNGTQRTTASRDCKPATSAIDLDINNVRARLMTGGDMWWDQGKDVAAYEVPKGSGKSSLFAGSAWIGGYDPQGNLKVAAQTYRQDGNDYWPGPLEAGAYTTSSATCSEWDRFWRVERSDINTFRDLIKKGSVPDESDPAYAPIYQWPAHGNTKAIGNSGAPLDLLTATTRDYAPYIDVSGPGGKPDGIYNPQYGDYPDILGDQYIWWVFNDEGNIKMQTQTDAIGMEVQASAFAFSTKDNLNNATFYNYRMINRSPSTLDTAFIATWTDADLGYAFDDFIGCDTARGLGILYNGKSIDGNGEPSSYGSQVPMVGVDFFIGPKRFIPNPNKPGTDTAIKLKMTAFTYFNNDNSAIGNPTNGQQIYGYMTGTNRGGQRFSYDWDGTAGHTSVAYGKGPLIKFAYVGEPDNTSSWSECTCGNKPYDRRFIHSSGPFQLQAGSIDRSQNDVTIGAVWVADVGGCPNTSFKKIRVADDEAQELFDNNFKTIEGPEAPRLVIREMDRKLVFYIMNDSNSTNFQEKFGYDLSDQKYRVASPKTRHFKDSLYKFEGYRIFQLKNSQISAAQIFDENGQVDQTVAAEVFQTDIRNGVSRIVNYSKATDISDTTWAYSVKVTGKDSGIVHSFSLQTDRFASTKDPRFVNYRNYYFVAIAYSYNQFAPFNAKLSDSTQDVPYLESAHGAGGVPIPIVVGMPNPANGDMGTTLNADYGSGVIVKRIEGIGNGANFISMDAASETAALDPNNNFEIGNPTYVAGQSPVNVKVVDPRKVQKGNWELFITGTQYADQTKGIIPTQGSWKLVYNGGQDVIYSERDLSVYNEQILENYGISVGLTQTVRPGDDQINSNGLVGSDVTFADPGTAWLTGVIDQESKNLQNWIRSGKNKEDSVNPCNYNDYALDTVGQFYENLMPNNALVAKTWAPFPLATAENRPACGFGVIPNNTSSVNGMYQLHGVDIVMTSDRTKWTRCVVFEMEDDPTLAEGGAAKYRPRKHLSWTGDVDGSGAPVYDQSDSGRSWFPGYAVDQETGVRLNVIFGEDSWLKTQNGADMIWNPTTPLQINGDGSGTIGNVINGGKHYIYVLGTKYDEGQGTITALQSTNALNVQNYFKNTFMWVGLPTLTAGFNLKSLKDGIIPTETRLRIRVSRPYAQYLPTGQTAINGNLPYYTFSTDGLAPVALTDNSHGNKDSVADLMAVVPNPYYGYSGYEVNRVGTTVRIINLPRRATVSIYSLDGTLVRRLEKDNANVSYLDWDILNAKSLPIASGMYLIHINAEGVGERIIRWFGAMRPVDITNY
ncbi:T9SS type A sorting domain-containing protein [Taibaiella soli]|uniref:T9SS C-terminal target domain-containing protein n=1 Tax=Taibaiella soli TaxID=1649169 RepID=A0A2W2BD49_9BACT|nr:T9SS type A sorting domain-containing protein [Taibaiella soli]PZF73787.1 hypothetical protein DN068_05450 [Taibaiella soli]